MAFRFKALLFVICLFTPLTSQASSHIKIAHWQENVTLTQTGKTSKAMIKGKVINFAPNQIMTAFSISFDPQRHIKIGRVVSENKTIDYTFKQNTLTITFAKPKSNNETFSLYFSYQEEYDAINSYLRHETISIPAFAAGAKARLSISYPGSWESATLNPNIHKSGNMFIYSNIVPQNGVHETIKLTPSQNIWDVAIKVNVKANKPLTDLIVTLPTYFQNGGQKVDNFISKSTIHPKKWHKKDKQRTFHFNTDKTSLTIHNNATISTGSINSIPISHNPNHHLYLHPEEKKLLVPLLAKIKNNSKYRQLPTYAKIGQFVHEFINYDERYVGRLSSIKEILTTHSGVCTEYASLYTALARAAGIPSSIINGAACGEYSKCQGHAWNIIYHNNQWIPVDPTWNLMSGTVSSSHVYFSDNGQGKIGIKYLGTKDMHVTSKMDFDMIKR